MKKLILILAAVMMIALPAAAYDFGGSLDLSGNLAGENFSDNVKLTGWAKVPFGTASFSTEAYMKGSFANETGLFDVSLLKVSFALPSVSLNLGRYSFSDVTSSVFAMTSDGANASLSAGILKVGAYVGYTGLLNGNTSGVGIAAGADPKAFYPLSAKYMVFLANAALPNVLGGNTFTAEFLGAKDMNGGTGAYDSFYGTASAAGALSASVFYSASVTASYLTTDSENIGLYAKGGLTCYLPFNSMSLGVNGAFGSKNFEGITYNPCSYGTLNAGVSATMKPINSLLCVLSADIDCTTANKFEASDASWTALAKWQAMTDVSAFLSLGQDIPLGAEDSSFNASFGVTASF